MKVEIQARMVARGFWVLWQGYMDDYIGMVTPKGDAPMAFVPPATRVTRSTFDVCVRAAARAWAQKRELGRKVRILETSASDHRRVYQVEISS